MEIENKIEVIWWEIFFLSKLYLEFCNPFLIWLRSSCCRYFWLNSNVYYFAIWKYTSLQKCFEPASSCTSTPKNVIVSKSFSLLLILPSCQITLLWKQDLEEMHRNQYCCPQSKSYVTPPKIRGGKNKREADLWIIFWEQILERGSPAFIFRESSWLVLSRTPTRLEVVTKETGWTLRGSNHNNLDSKSSASASPITCSSNSSMF